MEILQLLNKIKNESIYIILNFLGIRNWELLKLNGLKF